MPRLGGRFLVSHLKMSALKPLSLFFTAISFVVSAEAMDQAHETFLHFECSPSTGIISIENRLSTDRLPVPVRSEKISSADRVTLKRLGYYSVQEKSGKHTCKIGADIYSFFISYHPSRERGDCAAAEFWSLWFETPQRDQFVYTLDGDVCFPGQPLLKSLRLESTPHGRSLNVCSSDDIDTTISCRAIPLAHKGG